MRNMIDGLMFFISAFAPMAITIWLVLSLFGSFVKTGNNNCGKSYYVDYIIYTKLFCEVRND